MAYRDDTDIPDTRAICGPLASSAHGANGRYDARGRRHRDGRPRAVVSAAERIKRLLGWPLRRVLDPRVRMTVHEIDARLGSDGLARPTIHDRLDDLDRSGRDMLAGLGWRDVIKTTVYLHDMTDFPVVNEIYGRSLGEARPARSTIQVTALPRGGLIEIDLIAAAKQ